MVSYRQLQQGFEHDITGIGVIGGSRASKKYLEMAQEVLGTATNQSVLDLWEAVLAERAKTVRSWKRRDWQN